MTLPPAQKVNGPDAVIVGAAGEAFTVTTVANDDSLRQPSTLVTRTV